LISTRYLIQTYPLDFCGRAISRGDQARVKWGHARGSTFTGKSRGRVPSKRAEVGYMRVFFHILANEEKILDPDGHACADHAEARHEASQSARELIVNELRAGRPCP